jgi:branched-chain amino acid transport system substrate-binding protein
VVQKLINQDRVIAVVGEVASSRSGRRADLSGRPGADDLALLDQSQGDQVGDYIFRMCFLDDFQGGVMARFTAENLKLKKVALLKDVKSDYSVGLAQYFTDAFKGRGGTVVIEQAYSAGDQDFRAQLTAIKAKNPEAIVVPGYYTEAGLIARQARELGITVPLIGGDGWESEQLIAIGGDALNGCYYSNHWELDYPDPKLQEFVKRYHDKFKTDPDAIGGLAYDAANVLFGALDRLATQQPEVFKNLNSSKAGSADRKAADKALRDLIAGTTEYAGVTGTISLDQNRNATKPAVVIEIKDGKKIYNTSIKPA